MEAYLRRFRRSLADHRGSLVKVSGVPIDSAKEYLAKLAKNASIERAAWGWYYVPRAGKPPGALGFLAQDQNFKILTAQTAASVWNGDFIHRDAVSVSVDNTSYARALESFARTKGWTMEIRSDPDARKIPARMVGRWLVQAPIPAVVDCIKRWAFVDAVATLGVDMNLERLARASYWTRIPRTNVRVGPVVIYAAHRLFGAVMDARISDEFVRRQLDEAIEKVRQFA